MFLPGIFLFYLRFVCFLLKVGLISLEFWLFWLWLFLFEFWLFGLELWLFLHNILLFAIIFHYIKHEIWLFLLEIWLILPNTQILIKSQNDHTYRIKKVASGSSVARCQQRIREKEKMAKNVQFLPSFYPAKVFLQLWSLFLIPQIIKTFHATFRYCRMHWSTCKKVIRFSLRS